jgi:hypothetical protein
MRQVPAGRKVRLMARKDARNVKPTLSNDARNKLLASLDSGTTAA